MGIESALEAGIKRCKCGKCRVENACEHSRDTPLMFMRCRGVVMGAESAVPVMIRRCECGKCRVGSAS